MTALATPNVRLLASGWRRRVTTIVPIAAALSAAAVGLVLRAGGHTGNEALTHAGPMLLAAAFVLGVPHGMLDTDFLAPSGALLRPRRVAAMAGYLGLAAATFLAWTIWPAPAIGVLLLVSAAHFAGAEVSFAQARRRDRPTVPVLRSAVIATTAVAGPFAVWPGQTRVLLAGLRVDAAAASFVASAASVLLAVAVVVGVVTIVADLRSGDLWSAAEPVAVLLLVCACPPLVSFAVYFGASHSMRQTVRVLAVHPQTRDGAPSSAVVFRIVGASVAAVLALTFLVLFDAVGPGILVALLALSVPHAVTDAVRDAALRQRR